MAIIPMGVHYENFKALPENEIKTSDRTAQKILGDRKSITREELLRNPLFDAFKDSEKFNQLVDMFGHDVDAEELSFIVTVMDASKYEYNYKDLRFNEDQNGEKTKEPVEQGFYLDEFFGSDISDLIDVTKQDFEDYKAARNSYQKPEMGL